MNLMLVAAMAAPALGGPCGPQGVDAATLERSLGAVEEILLEDRLADAVTAGEEAREQLVCLEQPLEPPLALSVHQAELLRLYALDLNGQPVEDAEMIRALVTLRALDPTWTPGEEWWSAGSTMDTLTVASNTAPPSSMERAPRPAEGHLRFDGEEGRDRPADRPTVLQHLDGEEVITTAYLLPEQPLPDYARWRPVKPLAWAGVGLALGAGVATGRAFKGHDDYLTAVDDGDESAGEAARKVVNTSVPAAATLGGLALASGTSAWVMFRWTR